MFGKKQKQVELNPKVELEVNLLQNFSDLCVKKCLPGVGIEDDLKSE